MPAAKPRRLARFSAAVAAVACIAVPIAARAVPFVAPPPFVNEADFLAFTIDHHFSALRITELAAGTATVGSSSHFAGSPDAFSSTPARATDPVVLEMAMAANAAQRMEIVDTQGMLENFYDIRYVPRMRPPQEQLVEALEAALPGDPFNIAFLEIFSGHHATLLPPARECARVAPHAEVRAMCASMVAAQTREIEEMRAHLASEYGITDIPYVTIPNSDGRPLPAPASASLLVVGLWGLRRALRRSAAAATQQTALRSMAAPGSDASVLGRHRESCATACYTVTR